MAGKVGDVTKQRYRELVRTGRTLIRQKSEIQFQLGDAALEIEPMPSRGGSQAASAQDVHIEEALSHYADDIGIPFTTLNTYRWVSSRWPKEKRNADVSHHIHKILAGRDDRFRIIGKPPPLPGTGERRWTIDSAKRAAGQEPLVPVTPQEKINRVTD
nr:DUF6192 family protein [Amycolatopsis circi]